MKRLDTVTQLIRSQVIHKQLEADGILSADELRAFVKKSFEFVSHTPTRFNLSVSESKQFLQGYIKSSTGIEIKLSEMGEDHILKSIREKILAKPDLRPGTRSRVREAIEVLEAKNHNGIEAQVINLENGLPLEFYVRPEVTSQESLFYYLMDDLNTEGLAGVKLKPVDRPTSALRVFYGDDTVLESLRLDVLKRVAERTSARRGEISMTGARRDLQARMEWTGDRGDVEQRLRILRNAQELIRLDEIEAARNRGQKEFLNPLDNLPHGLATEPSPD
jgi:hypothetical protein